MVTCLGHGGKPARELGTSAGRGWPIIFVIIAPTRPLFSLSSAIRPARFKSPAGSLAVLPMCYDTANYFRYHQRSAQEPRALPDAALAFNARIGRQIGSSELTASKCV